MKTIGRMKIDLIPSIKETGLPLIEVGVCGRNRLFLLDSGSTANLVTSTLKDACPHSDAGASKSYSVGGNGLDCSMVKMGYDIAGVPRESEFMVTDPSTFDVFREESGLTVEGIMGIPFLIQHRCVVDFRKGRLSLKA